MKCKSCGHTFAAGPIGTGSSSSPGLFLIAALAGAGIAFLGYRMSAEEYPTVRIVLMAVGGALGLGGFLLTETAEQDATAYGPRRCPSCNAEVPVRPWSL